MKWISVLLICILLCGCLPKATFSEAPPAASQTSSPQPLTQSPTAAPTDVFKVNTWVNNPAPRRGEQVIVYGSLIKNGVLLGGTMMQGTWTDESHQPGTPNCFVLVTYGRGVCVVETSQFPTGRYVPVNIRFDYRNKTYTGSTGFTPR